jgi:molecular chaperone DnaJ
MSKRDFYEILGVAKSATDAELKAAFRKSAMACHPDRHPGDKDAERRFKELNEAYQMLSDGQKRAAYDRFGHAAFENGGGGQGGGFQGFGGGSMSDIFEDLFGDVFGGGGGQRRQSNGRANNGQERGADMRYNMEITLEEAYSGKSASIKVPTAVTCEPCSGSGAKSGSKARTCSTCGGAGRVRASQGFFAIERTCPNCAGRGEVIESPCSNCSGAGRVMKDRTLSVTIPAGVEDGTRIRLTGEGEAGARGGPTGDLYIFLSLKPHGFYQREGADLFCQVPISLIAATLGSEVKVPTVNGGEASVKIPEGTQSGKQFRLRGKGMPVLRSKDFGDLYIQAVVETPQNLTKRQRELLSEFDSESSQKTQPEAAGFFGRVKEFFGT